MNVLRTANANAGYIPPAPPAGGDNTYLARVCAHTTAALPVVGGFPPPSPPPDRTLYIIIYSHN